MIGIPFGDDRPGRDHGDRRPRQVGERRRRADRFVGFDRELGAERLAPHPGDEHRDGPLGARARAHARAPDAPRQIAVLLGGAERRGPGQSARQGGDRRQRGRHLRRRVSRRDRVGLPVDQQAGILGVHAGDGGNPFLGPEAAHLGARAAVTTRRCYDACAGFTRPLGCAIGAAVINDDYFAGHARREAFVNHARDRFLFV